MSEKQKNRLVFDIDGVVCNNTNGRYEDARPYPEMIKIVNELYDAGNYIILSTARGMGKYNGNQALAMKQWYSLTKMQVEGWGVKYHELHLGKIQAHVYIDDRAFRVRADGSSAEELRQFLNGDVSPENGKD
jgi:hypothetical protein